MQELHTDERLEFSAMSHHFARFMMQLADTRTPALEWAAALLCRAAEQGHVCLDLQEALEILPLCWPPAISPPHSLAAWSSQLYATSVVGRPGEHRPLVLDEQGRLYLYRFWRQEHDLAQEVRRRASLRIVPADENRLRAGIERLFGRGDGQLTDWQRVAAVTALLSPLGVISGGPGTGKTTTVIKIIALLLEQAAPHPLTIALAAPTGKAAARLAEAIRQARSSLDVDEAIRECIPDEAQTLHRLLGRARRGGFHHHRDHPLAWDVVIVDEASMVDLPLMAALLEALAPHSRLILLGDRDQLASVEAGAVLGDLCSAGNEEGVSATLATTVAAISGDHLSVADGGSSDLRDCVTVLRRSYRFDEGSGIGRLARSINQGRADEALALLRNEECADVCLRSLPSAATLETALESVLVETYAPYLQEKSVAHALQAFERSRLLAALRRGPFGVEQLNRLIEKVLARRGWLQPSTNYYRGRPILITGNDYRLGLFNGDVGLIWPDDENAGALRAFFPQAGGALRKILPSRLPPHETVFTMTVHKSQGSEFDRVLLLLPDRDSALLTRELLYTAVTRARKSVVIWGDEELFAGAVHRRIERRSGLRDALWKNKMHGVSTLG